MKYILTGVKVNYCYYELIYNSPVGMIFQNPEQTKKKSGFFNHFLNDGVDGGKNKNGHRGARFY